jgi:hypothetical protein
MRLDTALVGGRVFGDRVYVARKAAMAPEIPGLDVVRK